MILNYKSKKERALELWRKAQDLEQTARSRRTEKDSPSKKPYFPEEKVSEIYEEAGDKRIQSLKSLRDLRKSIREELRKSTRDSKKVGYNAKEYYELAKRIAEQVRYAKEDYNLAKRLAKTEEGKERLGEKISTIEKRVRESSDFNLRHSRPGLQWGFAVGSISSLVVALFFVSFNLTGSVVGNRDTSALIGSIFFVAGIVFTFFYFREKDKIMK
jgi:hypothetical protein